MKIHIPLASGLILLAQVSTLTSWDECLGQTYVLSALWSVASVSPMGQGWIQIWE